MNSRRFVRPRPVHPSFLCSAPASGLEASGGGLGGPPAVPSIDVLESVFFAALLGLHSAAAVSLLWTLFC